MRVSVERDDPGFRIDTSKVRVMFNGIEQSLKATGRAVITADEESGLIAFYQSKNRTGPLVETEGDRFKRFELHGDVKIVLAR